MADSKVEQSQKQDQGTGFSLDRERAKISIMKFILTALFTVLILILIISLITNQ